MWEEESTISKCGRKKAQSPTKIWEEESTQSPTTTIAAIPDGETDDTLDEQKIGVIGAVFKGSPDLRKVKHLMDTTFPIRRKSILTENMSVGTCKGIPTLGIQPWG